MEARGIQEFFTTWYYQLRWPFRRNREFRLWNDVLGAMIYAIFNIIPPALFVYLILIDFLVLRKVQSDEEREWWITCLSWFTRVFLVVYSANLLRLGYVFYYGAHGWFDFEARIHRPFLRWFWSSLKYYVEWAWEIYHGKTWKFIRGIQAQTREKHDLVGELAARKNLPPRVEALLSEFLTIRGVNELDYRWFLHDNRRKMRYLRKLDYKTRECIASFVIPKPAFKMNKDALVNLYCSDL